jgi:protease-4
MLAEIHAQFIAAVRQGRGERLKADADVFNGLVWSGTRSVELGLADALGSVDLVARDVIKAEYLVDFSHHEGLLDRLTKRFGASVAGALPASLGTGSANWRLR